MLHSAALISAAIRREVDAVLTMVPIEFRSPPDDEKAASTKWVNDAERAQAVGGIRTAKFLVRFRDQSFFPNINNSTARPANHTTALSKPKFRLAQAASFFFSCAKSIVAKTKLVISNHVRISIIDKHKHKPGKYQVPRGWCYRPEIHRIHVCCQVG